jgi:uncharacterized damage-inducible protein DinB
VPSPKPRTAADFEQLFRYTQWANARILDAMQTADPAPERAVELFSHLLRAQDIWYGRIQKTDHADLALWVDESLTACAERAEASAQRRATVLDGQAESDLDRSVSYTNSKGTHFETPLRDLLSHVVNHGTHHRAQIALVLREAGIAPPTTDYIFFVRNA